MRESGVGHIKFRSLLDSFMDMSGRQLMVLMGGEVWTIGKNPYSPDPICPSDIHGALENGVQDLALEVL